MRKVIITFFICSSFILADGQQIRYTYNSSGARIERKVISLTRQAKEEIEVSFEEELAEAKIVIYPNPTKGRLIVEITNMGDAQGDITAIDLKGKVIVKKKVLTNQTEIDLSNNPSGIYVLQIRVADKVSSWKIIKE